MAKIKPDETISVSIVRKNGESTESHTIDIQSTDQPLELIRPEQNVLGPGISSPASFLTTLRKPEVHKLHWAEIDSAMKTGDWKVQESHVDEIPAIDFVYDISQETAAKLELSGPFQIIKRYWLPRLDDSTRFDFGSRTFHINLQIIVKNLGNDKQSLALELDGPTGTPTEGWWYQNKIHGRQAAIGYLAGARDIVGETAANSYAFFGGPEIVANVQKTNPSFQYIVNPNDAVEDPNVSALKYVGVDTQYFNVSLIPTVAEDNTTLEYHCYSSMAGVASSAVPKEAKFRRLVDCTFYLFEDIELEPQTIHSQRYEIFAGPKETNLLTTYGLEDNRTFGWFAGFSKFLCWLLSFLYWATFSISYGLAIIMLTVIVRVLMIPLSRKAALNAQMMQLLAPEMKIIAEKHKDDMEKRSQAQRDLFRRNNYNPFGGCWLIFLQLPIFIGLYRGLSVDIALRDQPFIPGLRWCSNLAAPDALFYWKEWMPGFLASETGWLGPWFNVLPLVTIALFLVQQKLFTPPPTDEQQAMMHKMMSFMMVIMGVMFFKVPAGLCIYFITSSLWGIAERQLLPKPKLSDEKIRSVKGGLSPAPTESPAGGKSNGLFGKIKSAIEQRTGGSQPAPNPEETRRQDRERKKKLKERGF
jgi:YidC/Oxa1 family membrane protein insertase